MTINDKSQNVGVFPGETEEAGAAQPRVPPLSDTALVILAAAANRPDGSLLPVPASVKARRSTRSAVLFQLSQLGLAEEVPVKMEAQSWRRGEEFGFLGMRITAAGLAAIGIEAKGDSDNLTEPLREAASHETGGEAEPPLETPEQNVDAASPERPGDETGAASRFTDRGLERITVDDLVDDDNSMDFAVSGSETTSSRQPTKQDQILALLSREEGASIDELMAATGWLPHTVRACLSGLRKKGHAIDRTKDGDAGSVYRIVSSAETGAVPNAGAADDAS